MTEWGPRSGPAHGGRGLRLRTHWTPSPCDRLSRPRTTTGPPSHPTGISRQRTFPPTNWLLVGEGTDGMVPTFTFNRLTGSAPSYAPQHRHGYAAGFHRGLPVGDINRPKSSPHIQRCCAGARCCAALIHQVRAAGFLEERSVAGSSRTPFCLACRTRTIWQY